ncbi:uncharacterized protein HD556DRAFT_1506730 [Suillus plorans]|uniref:Uncharacterized protein n=1 Tax=Suillus plorans TaxID=116603 RepID=A0A9P7DBH6_9AGAM|nr:uncharacterized protein HD556DRAFT_1506730 [Suillus plorans]KAG1786594.1 hypothetical protein HD556DRAFT_1506730 [Suillus plorans]
MPPRIPPAARNNAVVQYKAILATSLAFSRTLNSRNIEFHWYPLWNQILYELFPVWFVPDDDEDDEDENDGDDPEEIIQPPEEQPTKEAPENQDNHNEDEDDEAAEAAAGDISFASTVPQKNAEGVNVDFVILHLKAVAQPQPELETRYGGWRITAASVGLLVEVKRFVSRSLAGENQTTEILSRILEACSDLIDQAACVFIQNPNTDSVLAIAAAGPYWRSATIRPINVRKAMHRISAKDPNYQAPGEQRPDKDIHWNDILRVDLPRSRDRLQTIYRSLKKLGVMDVV